LLPARLPLRPLLLPLPLLPRPPLLAVLRLVRAMLSHFFLLMLRRRCAAADAKAGAKTSGFSLKLDKVSAQHAWLPAHVIAVATPVPVLQVDAANKIKVVKEIRTITGLGIKEVMQCACLLLVCATSRLVLGSDCCGLHCSLVALDSHLMNAPFAPHSQ
jgi:ribosomal protein L7/L12